MVGTNKQDLIYKSGMKLFGKYGVKKVSIDMIVEDAGIAKGTFYLYYKNKVELYESIVDNILDYGTDCSKESADEYKNLQVRLLYEFVGTLLFFEKNELMRNIVAGNKDYFLGKVDTDYIGRFHMEMLADLLKDDVDNSISLPTLGVLIGLYTHLHNMKPCFKRKEKYYEFAIDVAAVIVNGLFTDYKNLSNEMDLGELKDEIKNLKY